MLNLSNIASRVIRVGYIRQKKKITNWIVCKLSVFALSFSSPRSSFSAILLPVSVEALEAREHEDIVVRLLVQLRAPIPRRSKSTVNTRAAIVPWDKKLEYTAEKKTKYCHQISKIMYFQQRNSFPNSWLIIVDHYFHFTYFDMFMILCIIWGLNGIKLYVLLK